MQLHKVIILRRKKKVRVYIIFTIIIILAINIYIYIEKNIKPTVTTICEVKAKVIATQAINEAVKSELEKDNIKEELIIATYDENGKINMLRTNTLVMNKLAADIALKVQENIKEVTNKSFVIPLGAALNSQILSKHGPMLYFDLVPQGSVLVNYSTEFEESGINQTRYKIYIIVIVDIKMIIPLSTKNIEITNNIPIAEVVIVGEVPDSYMELKDISD